jgi:uncharacterized membrane protein YoaK (UPF0700 family)
MKNKATVIFAILLIISIGNVMRVNKESEIRTVEFISIFIVGAISAALIASIIGGKKR